MSPRPSRSTSAHRPFPLAVSGACCALLLVAAGCGNEGEPAGSQTATDSASSSPSASSTPSTSDSPVPGDDTSDSSSGGGGTLVVGDAVEPGQAVVVSASNVKVETSKQASALSDDQAVDGFVAAMDPQLADDVRRAVDQVRAVNGSTLFGVVASVGCEAPTSVAWVRTFDGIEVEATLPKPSVQCLVPVTSVALFLVPSDLG